MNTHCRPLNFINDLTVSPNKDDGMRRAGRSRARECCGAGSGYAGIQGRAAQRAVLGVGGFGVFGVSTFRASGSKTPRGDRLLFSVDGTIAARTFYRSPCAIWPCFGRVLQSRGHAPRFDSRTPQCGRCRSRQSRCAVRPRSNRRVTLCARDLESLERKHETKSLNRGWGILLVFIS